MQKLILHPVTIKLVQEYKAKTNQEKQELVELLTKRASIVSRQRKGCELTDEERKIAPFGAFCPDFRQVIWMGVKLGVYRATGLVPTRTLVTH